MPILPTILTRIKTWIHIHPDGGFFHFGSVVMVIFGDAGFAGNLDSCQNFDL